MSCHNIPLRSLGGAMSQLEMNQGSVEPSARLPRWVLVALVLMGPSDLQTTHPGLILRARASSPAPGAGLQIEN